MQTQKATSLVYSLLPLGIMLVNGFQRILSMSDAAERFRAAGQPGAEPAAAACHNRCSKHQNAAAASHRCFYRSAFDLPAGFLGQIRSLRLTSREADIAAALAAGVSLKDAERNAHIQFSTARSHLERIFRKTPTSRAQLIALKAYRRYCCGHDGATIIRSIASSRSAG